MSLGYNDTPMIPGQDWHVHDSNRPQPVIVTPGASGPGDPPSDAIVLFNGMDVSAWQSKDGGQVEWKIASEHRSAGHHGRATTEILMGIHESARLGEVVHMPLGVSGYPMRDRLR